MKNYELVTVIDTNLSGPEIKAANEAVQKLLGKGILDTDEIGLMPTAYPILGQDQWYYVSYHVELDGDHIDELKSDLKLIKWIAKFTLFGMWIHEKFLKMWELTKRREDLSPAEEASQEEEQEQEEESQE